jgi:hypothetical protein
VSTRKRGARVKTTNTALDLAHLRRETRTALELAVVVLAPAEIIDQLAAAAGLFEALVELPEDSPPVVAPVPRLVAHSTRALNEWQKWRVGHLEKRIPRG